MGTQPSTPMSLATPRLRRSGAVRFGRRAATIAAGALSPVLCLTMPVPAGAQEPRQPTAARADTAARRPRAAQPLETVRVTARVAPRTVTFLPERHGAVLLTGKKTEVLLVDSVGANAAQNVARQVLGRVRGSWWRRPRGAASRRTGSPCAASTRRSRSR